uniref:Wound-responsive family protein n=1 Tax=Glycine max TaxID=3847 RepID=C6TCQ6_SOYBN|nr:unknown [Glycine max]
MSSGIRAWSVAASVGVVEALKDQGICRWNHALRSAQHHLKNHVGSFSQANKLSFSAIISTTLKHEKAKQSEESFRTVMYLSCWGPN